MENSKSTIVAIIAIAVGAIAIMAAIVAFALGGPGALFGKESSEQPEKLTTYRTHLYERLGLPGPAFAFDYPDNWTVTKEECDPDGFSEHVVLTSDSGRTVDFNFGNACVSTSFIGPSEKVASLDFSPEPYADLERPPMVHDYEWHDLSDDEIRALDFKVSSVSRPEHLGKGFGYSTGGWYYGYFQFMSLGFAKSGTDVFSETDKREVIQILSSLRQEPA